MQQGGTAYWHKITVKKSINLKLRKMSANEWITWITMLQVADCADVNEEFEDTEN